jgi:hypothetical protein
MTQPGVSITGEANQDECRQLDGSTPKPARQWDPWKLLDQVKDWVKAGIKVYSCYSTHFALDLKIFEEDPEPYG